MRNCYIPDMNRFLATALLLLIAGDVLPHESAAGFRAMQTDIAPARMKTDSVRMKIDSVRNTWHGTLTGSDAGLWFCAWSERTRSGAEVRGAFLRRGQRADILAFDLGLPGTAVEEERPAGVFLTDSTVLLVWQRRSEGRQAITARIVHRSGLVEPAFGVSDQTAPEVMPTAGRNAAGEIVVAWQDYRNGNADIYAQRFDTRGRRIGANVLVNDDGTGAMQGQPRVAADNGDSFLLLWPDNRIDGAWKFYYHRFGGHAARNVLIDSAQRKAMTTLISGVCLPGDSAFFAWKDYRAGTSNIYRRIADLRRGAFSPAERVNDDEGNRWQRLAAVDGNGRGEVVVCWEDYRNTVTNQRGDTYLQPFARDGSRVGVNIRVNDRDDRRARKMPSIVMDPDGWYLVIWHQGEEGIANLVGQWMRFPAQREGANFCLTCDGR